MNRMNREQFFAKLALLDEKQAKQALWNVYWRGAATVRERIEAELEPGQAPRRGGDLAAPVDSVRVLEEVRGFVSLARSGAYMGGDRRVSPQERTRWRSTFKRLLADTRAALRAQDLTAGAAALEALIDLACEMRDYDYFHSTDPVEAARLVVSDEVALLWGRIRDHAGFPAFAEGTAAHLIRWESRFGWTRTGFGQISQREVSLASVLAGMLSVPDAWRTFADCYLAALDRVAAGSAARPGRSWRAGNAAVERRTDALAEWHGLLLQRLVEDESEDRLNRLTAHPALGGPELTFLQARLAHHRGQADRARSLVHESLTLLPGHRGFLDFAAEVGAPLPPRAHQIRTGPA
jgi:hypothetical protein